MTIPEFLDRYGREYNGGAEMIWNTNAAPVVNRLVVDKNDDQADQFEDINSDNNNDPDTDENNAEYERERLWNQIA
jgi:hypothetical protein